MRYEYFIESSEMSVLCCVVLLNIYLGCVLMFAQNRFNFAELWQTITPKNHNTPFRPIVMEDKQRTECKRPQKRFTFKLKKKLVFDKSMSEHSSLVTYFTSAYHTKRMQLTSQM